jgi:hypothetical protein
MDIPEEIKITGGSIMKDTWKLINPAKAEFEVYVGDERIDKKLFNHIPYILIPISKTMVLYVGVKPVGAGYHTFLSDIKFVKDKGWCTNVEYAIIANKKAIAEFIKSIDKSRNKGTNCMGFAFFLKKLNLLGFDVISKFRG